MTGDSELKRTAFFRLRRIYLAGLTSVLLLGLPAPVLPMPSAESFAPSLEKRRVMLTGALRSTDAEPIHVPLSNVSPVVLRQLVPDGSLVAPGDLLVRVDSGAAVAQINDLKSQIGLTRARIDKELAELDVHRIDAALALVDAEAARARAEVDAAIPGQHLARIDFDRFQGEAERTRREVVLSRKAAANAEAALQRRRRDGMLEVAKLEADRVFAERQIVQSEQRTTSAGTVIFGFDPWSGLRYQEGLSASPGTVIGEVVGAGELAVRAFALEVDRRVLAVGQRVDVGFDALPSRRVAGLIVAISGVPEPKAEWGGGRYFTIDVTLEDAVGLPLRPGMSVRVDSRIGGIQSPMPRPLSYNLRLEGEIAAKRSSAIAPPSVPGQWQFQISQIAQDGSMVRAGQVVVAFDADGALRRLQVAQGRLSEKRSERERLMLDLSEREKAAQLMVEEQRAELVKSERKASQPAELLRSVEYRKLVIDREQAERRLVHHEKRYAASTILHRAERALMEAELAHYEAEVATLTEAVSAMQIRAPRDGVLVLRSNWRGERFEVGSQVFVGQAVAEIPEPETFHVRATVAERDMFLLQEGMRARVRIEGGAGRYLDAVVVRIGAAVRSKSRLQPIPVVDVDLDLQGDIVGLKTGQAVSLELKTRGPEL